MSEAKFDTDRLRTWRDQELKESFTETLNRIEKYGCEVWSIAADYTPYSFSYTVGNFDICGSPEIITIALQAGTAHYALNEACKRMRSGQDLTVGRHSDLVGKVDVEFRPVDPKWLHHMMLRTNWYYQGEDVPVLQLVYPDLENRFPGEPDFDVAFEQPFLSGDDADGESLASDLWAAYDKTSSLSRWKFKDNPHRSAYLSQTVFDGEETITYVSHDDNGDWQFLGDKMIDGGGPVVVCLHHPIDKDSTLEVLHDLPLNWYATREEPDKEWRRFEHPPSDDQGKEDDVAPVN